MSRVMKAAEAKGQAPPRIVVVRKNNSALRISTIRAIGSDVRLTLRVGRFADVTSAESRRNNVMHSLATRRFYSEPIYCGASFPSSPATPSHSAAYGLRLAAFDNRRLAAVPAGPAPAAPPVPPAKHPTAGLPPPPESSCNPCLEQLAEARRQEATPALP